MVRQKTIFLIFLYISSFLIVLGAFMGTSYAKSEFKIPLQYDNLRLDPADFPDSDSIWIATQIYDGLFELSPSGDIKPALAKDWQISPDAKSLKLFLRKNVKFSDGSPFTSADVIYSLSRSSKKSKREEPLLKLITNITAIDDHTLQIQFTKPLRLFPRILSSPYYSILPKKYQAQIEQGTFFNKPIGTGPYEIAEWIKGKRILLKKNPHYWGKDFSITNITFQFSDPKKPWVKKDLMNFDLQLAVPAYSLKVPQGFVSQWYNNPTIEFLGFNLKHPFWKKTENRIAFNKIFNKQEYYKELFKYRQKSWRTTQTIIPYGMLASPKKHPSLHNVSKETLENVKKYLKTDPTIYFASHDHLPEADLDKSVTVAVNNNVQVKRVSYPELTKLIKNNRVGIFVMRLVADSYDPFEILVYFSGDSPENFTGYENRQFTTSLRDVRTMSNDNERSKHYSKLANQLNDDVVVIPIASMFNERLFVKETCKLEKMNPLGPRYYKLNNIRCKN